MNLIRTFQRGQYIGALNDTVKFQAPVMELVVHELKLEPGKYAVALKQIGIWILYTEQGAQAKFDEVVDMLNGVRT